MDDDDTIAMGCCSLAVLAAIVLGSMFIMTIVLLVIVGRSCVPVC